LLVGLLKPTRGEIKILNSDIEDINVKQKIGYVPERLFADDFLTAYQFMKYHGRLAGLSGNNLEKRINFILERFCLTSHKDKKIITFSKGMRQRLAFANALINEPEIIFLDEPTADLDPVIKAELTKMLFDLKEEGKTLIINSHLLEEIGKICDKIGILDKGKLISFTPIEDVFATTYKLKVKFEKCDAGLKERIKTMVSTFKFDEKENFFIIPYKKETLNTLLKNMLEFGIPFTEIVTEKASVSDYFLNKLIKTFDRGAKGEN